MHTLYWNIGACFKLAGTSVKFVIDISIHYLSHFICNSPASWLLGECTSIFFEKYTLLVFYKDQPTSCDMQLLHIPLQLVKGAQLAVCFSSIHHHDQCSNLTHECTFAYVNNMVNAQLWRVTLFKPIVWYNFTSTLTHAVFMNSFLNAGQSGLHWALECRPLLFNTSHFHSKYCCSSVLMVAKVACVHVSNAGHLSINTGSGHHVCFISWILLLAEQGGFQKIHSGHDCVHVQLSLPLCVADQSTVAHSVDYCLCKSKDSMFP